MRLWFDRFVLILLYISLFIVIIISLINGFILPHLMLNVDNISYS